MHTNNFLGLLTAPTPVGSGDLLGGWSLLILGIINITVIMWSIVDMTKIHRDSVKNIHRENDGERNKPSRISLQDQSRLKLLVGKIKSAAKSKTARENGKLGGRPRKPKRVARRANV
jgi:hypothetical protein